MWAKPKTKPFYNFVKSIKPILVQNQILGFATFTVSDGKFNRPSKLRYFLNILFIIAFILFNIYACYVAAHVERNKSLYRTTEIFFIINCTIFVLAAWAYGIFYSKKMIQLLEEMIKLDTKLLVLDATIVGKYEKQRKRDIVESWLRTVFLIGLATFFYFIRVYLAKLDIYSEITRFFALLFKSANCQQVIQLVSIMKSRFKNFNDLIRKLTLNGSKTSQEEILNQLYQICEMHHHLTSKILTLFNEIFGVLLLVFFGSSFVILVICSFYLTANLQATVLDWKFILMPAILVSVFIFDVIYICNVCFATSEQGKLTAELIHKLETGQNNDLIDQVEMFLLQIANNKIEISAADFFTVDHTLLFTIIGGVTTYIIILIQLSDSLIKNE